VAARPGVAWMEAYDSQCWCRDGPLVDPGTSQKHAPQAPAPAAMLYWKSL